MKRKLPVRPQPVKPPTGFTLYEGPSLLDGKPIVAIATVGPTENPKTGQMIQTWILRSDIEPHLAARNGADRSVCGDCPLRPENSGACYVTLFQAPLAVYRAWTRGAYPAFDPERVSHCAPLWRAAVRLGSYGDPAAVPLQVWFDLLSRSSASIGYTHQWKRFPWLKRYLMASVDTPEEAAEASAKGWRYFRVRLPHEPLLPDETICPASAEAGHQKTCVACLACNGNTNKPNVAIIAHGPANKRHAYETLRTKMP